MSVISTIVFHCRFGGGLGWGHVIRSSALAEAAQERGWKTVLYSSSDFGLLNDETLAAFDRRVSEKSERMEEALREADAIFVDEMYWQDEDYERVAELAQANECLIAATDDMQQRRLACVPLIVNPEPGLSGCLYERTSVQLLGDRYCFLRKGFRGKVEAARKWDESLCPVFVMMGGSDAFGLSADVLDALYAVGGSKVAPVLVSGEIGSQSNRIESALSQFCEYEWHRNLGSAELASWMMACRFGIVGCGSSIFEMGALGVPFVGLSMVDNQRRSADAIRKAWGVPIVELEDRSTFGDRLEKEVLRLMGALGGSNVARGEAIVDCLGADRVMQAIESHLSQQSI